MSIGPRPFANVLLVHDNTPPQNTLESIPGHGIDTICCARPTVGSLDVVQEKVRTAFVMCPVASASPSSMIPLVGTVYTFDLF